MTTYIVEGRRFRKHLHAITFARHLAKIQDRAVEVIADVSTTVEKVDRKWLATMHPPGTKRSLHQKRLVKTAPNG
jgi:hypothetical protein